MLRSSALDVSGASVWEPLTCVVDEWPRERVPGIVPRLNSGTLGVANPVVVTSPLTRFLGARSLLGGRTRGRLVLRRVSGSDQTLFRGGWRSCAVVTAIQSTQNEVTGQPICSSRLSGVGCGTLQSTNVCMVGGICGQRLASGQYACGGDSGSPVYQTTSSTTARAVGIIAAGTSGSSPCPNGDPSGSSSLYTHVQLAANAAGATLITN